MVNMKNNTALHEAVEYNQIEAAKFLIEKDPELVMFTNNAGDSSLFMAVDKLHLPIASCILQFSPASNFRGSNNMNVLHALVIRLNSDVSISDASSVSDLFHLSYSFQDKVTDVMKFIKSRRIFKSNFKSTRSITEDSIKRLIERRVLDVSEADIWTPLHYAAYFGNEDVVKQLIDEEISSACIKEKDGMTVLHIAAKQGRVNALKVIMACCPDIWDVESEKIEAIKFIMDKVSMDTLNQQDNAGDTPLHLASRRRNPQIVELMVKDSRVNKTILNNEGDPVIDILSNTKFSNLSKGWMAWDLLNAGCITSKKGEVNCSRREAAADKSGKKDKKRFLNK